MACFATPYGLRYAAHCFNRADAQNNRPALIPAGGNLGVTSPRRRMTVRDLLTTVNTETGVIHVPRLASRDNRAAIAPELTEKNESSYTFDLEPVQIHTIAHHTSASRQILSDVPQLRDLIDGELRYGLALAEEAELLFGAGGPANVLGMTSVAAEFESSFSPDLENMIDQIGLALLQVALTDVPPDGVIVHPSDWFRMRLLKNEVGEYLLGAPGAQVEPRLFGLPVVATQAMQPGHFLAGAFAAQTLYDRQAPVVMLSTEHGDNFIRNRVTLLAEERIGFVAKQPESLVFGAYEPES